MPTGLLGGLCKGCKEDRDGLRNWENTYHERVGGQCVRKSSLVLVCAKDGLPPGELVEFFLCWTVGTFVDLSRFRHF